ncbi:acyltransferase family protein [Pseudoneobacillus sp. C159]
MNDLRTPIKKFRPEIEGVRAVAAFLVAIYHIWIGKVSGGVDVFFIVSGYLITTSLLSKIDRDGGIQFFDYLAGLAKRLFPIAFTVLFLTTLTSILVMPQTQWMQIMSESFTSAFYYQNWQLANNAVDYLAQNNGASPFQHFWALSIQGQFYVTWPIIILLAFFIAKKVLRTPVRKTLLAILLLIFTTSITYSIYKTSVNQPWAYFDTFARVWEFSLGGILALTISYFQFEKSVNVILGWVGLAIICLTGMLLPVSSVFPGYAALFPTTGVILIIISAENNSRIAVNKLLGSKPFLFFGSISYGFYLWHWPILIFYFAIMRTDAISLQGGLIIIGLAFILSVISTKGIETPIRKMNVNHSRLKLAAVLITFMIPVFIVNTTWGVTVNQTMKGLEEELVVEEILEAVAAPIFTEPTPNQRIIPSTIHVKYQLPAFYENPECYSEYNDPKVKVCSFGEAANPEYTIALVGGSHSGHWFPALEEIAATNHLRIDVYNKDACRFSDDNFNGQLHDSCMEWNKKLLEKLIADPPDYVFTTANIGKEETIPAGYLSQWRKLEGITEVFAIRDNPRMLIDPPVCVDEGELTKCMAPKKAVLSDRLPWENTEGIPSNVTFADLTKHFCDDENCSPVIGNILAYRDLHHISTYYSKMLAPALAEHLIPALEKLNKYAESSDTET